MKPAPEIQKKRLEAVPAARRPRLCQNLVSAGKLAPGDRVRALRVQREQESWERIGSIIVKLGLAAEKDVAVVLAAQLGCRMLTRSEFPEPLPECPDIAPRFLKNYQALIIDVDDKALTVAMADPLNAYVKDALRLASGREVRVCLALPSDIDAALSAATTKEHESVEAADALPVQYLDDVEQLKELAGEAPIIKQVNRLINDAAEAGASDIHIEPFEGQLKIRYRIDGALREIESLSLRSAAAVVSRIKIMASLDIAERRLAQDGRCKQRVRGIEYDLRVSTVPTMHGESVVLRLLKRNAEAIDFPQLGFSKAQQDQIHSILETPHGIMLVTGPTGSGKSTTLYAALQHLNQPDRMIITVEDPVEYNIPNINQMQVKPQIGMTFASALRSIVRQDPDVIMIGEMRDTETAQIAVQSALTGHLVLSTLHTNDAAGSIVRLLDMGVQDYLLVASIIAIQAQRLVRTLCPHCREPYEPLQGVIDRWRLDRFAGQKPFVLYRPVGCEECGGSGYSGRQAILEILTMSEGIRERVLNKGKVSDIVRVAIDEGMVPMRDDGLAKVVAGTTTIEEVLRVTPEHNPC
jgi:general secretion pathway protein E